MATSSLPSSTKYRADIDGLRAVAVGLVLLDHLQVRHFSGGYVGVDVFFVISGYLIGASLISEFRGRTFSLTAFYERRCRRILPALIVMVAFVSILAFRDLMPTPFVAYQYSAIAALLSLSNFLFWRQSGYFDTLSASKPLLHTWSLAVEEQFYLGFPLFLLLVFRWFPSRQRTALWMVSAISFILAIVMVRVNSATAFFWSPLRAWELMLGCMVSQYSLSLLRRAAVRETVAGIGLTLIASSAMIYSSQTPFPGASAMFPCLGAAMIIAAGQSGPSFAGRLLSTAPFNFVGRISYSLYLWHWPLIVFQQTSMIFSARPLWMLKVKLAVGLASIIAATLSWRFVETPFRSGRLKPDRTTLFRLTGGAVALLLLVCGGLIRANGLPGRFPEEARRIAAFADYDSSGDWRKGTCFLSETSSFADFKPSICLSETTNQRQYLIFGDSTAADLYPGLSQVFPAIHFQQATSAACPPLLDAQGVNPRYLANCRALLTYINQSYIVRHVPNAILLAASWSSSDLPALGSEIRFLHEQKQEIILVGPELEFDANLPTMLSIETMRRDSEKTRSERISGHMIAEGAVLDRKMKELAQTEWHVRYISIFDTLCNQQLEPKEESSWRTTQNCPLFTETGDPIIFDGHHFTRSASVLFAETLRSQSQLP